MIWLITGAILAGVWLLLVILYVTGDLKRMTCGHHDTEKQELKVNGASGPWVEIYWKCHTCGKTRGRPL